MGEYRRFDDADDDAAAVEEDALGDDDVSWMDDDDDDDDVSWMDDGDDDDVSWMDDDDDDGDDGDDILHVHGFLLLHVPVRHGGIWEWSKSISWVFWGGWVNTKFASLISPWIYPFWCMA